MSRRMVTMRLGVSEIVSTLILLVIATSLGAVVIAWAANYSGVVLRGIADNIDRARFALLERPVIEHAVVNVDGNNITLYVSNAGSIDIQLDAIYVVNDTVRAYNDTFYYKDPNTNAYVEVSRVTLAPTELIEVAVVVRDFTISSGSRYVVAVITTEGNRAQAPVAAP